MAIVYVVLGLMLLAVLLFWGIVRLYIGIGERRKGKRPASEKLLRSPGYSVRRMMDARSDSLFDLAVGFVASMVIVGLATIACFAKDPHGLVMFQCLAAAALLGAVWFADRMWRAMSSIADMRLGLSGEMAVSEELNKLLSSGCRVFHDVPKDDDANIDHVVVAPSGVFVVETKTRRKKATRNSAHDYRLQFDGVRITFPHGSDTHGIDQAKQNAKWLSQLIAKSTGATAWVTPILTFPGWFVESRVANGDIVVTNPKQIESVIRSGSPQLSPARIQAIAYQLDQRCRTIEF